MRLLQFRYGTLATISKMLLNDIPNLETLAISGFLAFVFLLILNVKSGIIKEMSSYSVKDYLIMAGHGFLGLFLYSALYYYGLTQLTSQEACILNYLCPLCLCFFFHHLKGENYCNKRHCNALFLFRHYYFVNRKRERSNSKYYFRNC